MALIVEVNHRTARADHGYKLRRYAEVGVLIYWVVEAVDRTVLVHDGPAGRGEAAGYGRRTTYAIGDAIPVVFDGREVARIAAAELFPPDPAR